MHTDLATPLDEGTRKERTPAVPAASSTTMHAEVQPAGDQAMAAGPNKSSVPRASLQAQLDALPAPVRQAMVNAVASASSADEALAPVISLLVDGPDAKRDAIVQAFRTNDPLREQWERTYEILRAEARRS